MEQFVVSARKYRPKDFDEVIGQEHITTTLVNAIKSNHLAQAFLFCGPRGVGKTTCARIVARMINSFDESQEQALIGGVPGHMNIYELDAASNNSVDDIRALVDQVRYPPQYGKYKVYIIDEVHMLSNSAFNAFLKTLEEPPPYAIFILATTEKHKVIPTILSRCQIFDFKRIQQDDIVSHLLKVAEKENITAEPEALNFIAQKADGAMRDALSLFDLISTFSSDRSITYKLTIDTLHILDHDYYFKAVTYILQSDSAGMLLLFDEVLRYGFDAHQFLVGFSEHLRNLMVCKDPQTAKLLPLTGSLQQRYIDQSSTIDLSTLVSALQLLSDCELQYRISKNQRLHVELTLIKLSYLKQVLQIEQEKKITAALKTAPVIRVKDEFQSSNSVAKSRMNLSPVSASPKLPSIDGLKSLVQKEQSIGQVHEEQKPLQGVQPNQNMLNELWKDLAELKKMEGRITEQLFFQHTKPELENENLLWVVTDSEVEIKQLSSMTDSLRAYFKAKKILGLDQIKAKRIGQIVVGKSMISTKEKLQALSQEYPLLDELRTRLSLDID
jgi:DNA polymerase III subunit gamma/tau